jgi:hypothetical protein
MMRLWMKMETTSGKYSSEPSSLETPIIMNVEHGESRKQLYISYIYLLNYLKYDIADV